MDESELIFVIGPGRCLTSAVTGLFNQMGVWVGTARQHGASYNPKGFFENVYFKRLVQSVYKQRGMICVTRFGWPTPKHDYNNPLFKQQLFQSIARDGYKRGPVALKNVQVAAILDILKQHFPNAYYLHVVRDHDEIVTSFLKKYEVNKMKVSKDLISEWVENANRVCAQEATHSVKAADVVNGDTQVLETIVDNVGLTWDQQKADEFIDQSMWHGKL